MASCGAWGRGEENLKARVSVVLGFSMLRISVVLKVMGSSLERGVGSQKGSGSAGLMGGGGSLWSFTT